MNRDVTAALRRALQGHLSLRKSRLESFCVLVVGVLLSRTVNLSHLACLFPTRAAIASNYRRLQRFFEQGIVDGSQLARVIVRIAGVGVRHRTSRYLNNRLEQDHRGIKGRYRSMRGFKCPRSAARFCRAYDELRNFLRLRSRPHQHVPADRRRLLHLRRSVTVLAILQAA